jgi:hypothetical protein
MLGGMLVETALMTLVLMVCLAATSTAIISPTIITKVSSALETWAIGGRPQSPIPCHGIIVWPATETISTGTASTILTTELLNPLAASGIKKFKLEG